ncbi:MAG: GNAT family N-acetyltransferase [Pseudomonadota bacterium]
MDGAIRTPRLTGRPAAARDWPLILEILEDPQSGRHLTAPGLEASEARARRVAEGFAEAWRADGFGPRVWSLPGGRALGYAGVRRAMLEGVEVVEALWALLPAAWGRGYAQEAVRAALEQDAPGPIVMAWTLPENAASLALMTRLGFLDSGETSRGGLRHLVRSLAL